MGVGDEWRMMSEDEAGLISLAKQLCESADPIERWRLKEENCVQDTWDAGMKKKSLTSGRAKAHGRDVS
jgi:hypothetical protein